jgi:hypothetical protein
VKDVLVASTETAPFCSYCRCLVSVVNAINLPRRLNKHSEVCRQVNIRVLEANHSKNSVRRIILHDVGPRLDAKILLTTNDGMCIILRYRVL